MGLSGIEGSLVGLSKRRDDVDMRLLLWVC